MTSIVTTHYRYKRPPRKRKATEIEGSTIITAKSSRRPNLEAKAAAEVPRAPVSREEGAAAQPSTPIVTAKSSRRPPVRGTKEAAAEASEPPAITATGQRAQSSTPREAERVATPANDDRKSAIVTIKRKSRFGDAPDLTPEEHQRRGEAADALWRGLVGQATAKDGKSAAVSAEPSSPTTKPAIVVTARKRRSDGPHLPMELPLSRKPVERDGDDYKRMKAAMARRLRGADE